MARIPKLCRQARPGRADDSYVVLNGVRQYCGEFGTAASSERYGKLIAEWSASGGHTPVAADDLTVVELSDRFIDHAETYYRRPDGTPTSEGDNFAQAIKPLVKLYGRTPAAEFGPLALRAVRQRMIDAGWCRTNINKQTNRIRHVFRWGVSQQIVRPDVLTALEAVAPLKRGRCDAEESPRKLPVPQAHIDAIEPHVGAPVWAMIRLQLLTGARAGELTTLRAIDFDTTGAVWTATLDEHKTAHHGRERVLYFGPQAQRIVSRFMAGRAVDAFLFDPREANAERKQIDAEGGRRPKQKPNPRKTDRTMGEHYTTDTYRRAIDRACKAAGVPAWSPHRLRHTAATLIRKEFGVEAAQVMLGHARADTTQIYAQVNHAKAVTVAMKIG